MHRTLCHELSKYISAVVRNRRHCYIQLNHPIVRSNQAHFIRQLTTMDGRPVTAGILVIGDEIVKGQVQDCNSFYLCQRFHHMGVDVKAVIAIPDDISIISDRIREFSAAYTYVVTAGGIGPTHDDITYEAVAKAFNDKAEVNEHLEQLYKGYLKSNYTDAHRKLATIPTTAQLVPNKQGFPIVNIKNVYILPGVPRFLKLGFCVLESIMQNPDVIYVTRSLYLNVDELSITHKITEINELFKETVSIGSYPEWHNNYYKLKITLESKDSEALDQCEKRLRHVISAESFVTFDCHPLQDPVRKLRMIAENQVVGGKVKESVHILKDALQRYNLDEICIGFNGGKDCTLLLHIWYLIVRETFGESTDQHLQALYIRCQNPFPEIEQFIEESIVRYCLNMLRFEGSIKEQLAQMKVQQPHIKAVIMGTRSTDPHGSSVSSFSPTDPDWPQYMRINPMLNWTYNEVWYFLRELCVPYCCLYDMGYTSIGNMENTHPNPALRFTDSHGIVKYRSACTLDVKDEGMERAGRTAFQKPANSN